jgi:hypothetical protein
MMEGRSPYELVKPIREVFLRAWNPIGFAVPEDEYDSYMPGVLKLLLQGADAQEISNRLYTLETVSMGMPGDRERSMRVAGRLLSLIRGRPE